MGGAVVSPVAPDGVGSMGQNEILELVEGSDQTTRNVNIQVVWLENLDFAVTAGDFYLDGTRYSITGETVTLANGDGSNPRFDVIVAETDGTAGVVAGTPAADPAIPDVDFGTQVALTTVLVAQSATTPSDISNTAVYEENTEWTTAESDSGTTIDLAATADPHAGSVHIEFVNVVNGDFITFTDSVTHSATEFVRLFMYIKFTAPMTARGSRLLMLFLNGTVPVSDVLRVGSGTYGLNGNNTSSYQLLSIPMADFNLSGTNFDVLKIQVLGQGAATVSANIDKVGFQAGALPTDTSNFARVDQINPWSKAQGSSITTLTDAATIDWDMAFGNVYQITLDGNRTMDAPDNIIPGYTYILLVYQDAVTGSRTITWNAVFKWPADTAPTLSTGVGDLDIFTFIADASGNLHGVLGSANSS
jgi:hypothetical protein